MQKSNLVAQIIGSGAMKLAQEFLRVAGEPEETLAKIKKQRIRFFDSGETAADRREKLLVMDCQIKKQPTSVHIHFTRYAGMTSVISISTGTATYGGNLTTSIGEGLNHEIYHYSRQSGWVETDHELEFVNDGESIEVGRGQDVAKKMRRDANALLRAVEKEVQSFANITP